MAAYLFTRAILAGEPIKVFNEGRMARDFTYIDDIVQGTIAAHDRPPGPGVHRIYNLGNHRPEQLLDFIAVHRAAARPDRNKDNCCRCSPAMSRRASPTSKPARRDLGFEPKATIETGLASFVRMVQGISWVELTSDRSAHRSLICHHDRPDCIWNVDLRSSGWVMSGLPVALALAKKFEPVIGFDISRAAHRELRDGNDLTGEVGRAELRADAAPTLPTIPMR